MTGILAGLTTGRPVGRCVTRAGIFTYGACRVQGLLDVGVVLFTQPVGTKIRPSRKPR